MNACVSGPADGTSHHINAGAEFAEELQGYLSERFHIRFACCLRGLGYHLQMQKSGTGIWLTSVRLNLFQNRRLLTK